MSPRSMSFRLLSASALTLILAGAALAAPAALDDGFSPADRGVESAQGFNRSGDMDEGPAGPAVDSGLGLRMDRLERDNRRLTGQMEEMQHQVQKLEEQLRAARQDAALAPRPADHSAAVVAPPPVAPAGAGRRGDAFDPAAQPTAPGAPRTLGATTPSAPLAAATPHATQAGALRDANTPLDLTHGRAGADVAAVPAGADLSPVAPSPREDYDHASSAMRSGQYEAAEKGFASFLAKNPKSKLASSATFNLAESFFLRGRNREAAEKYLEISTKYPQSSQAPEAMLRLGQSLNALGAKEQACASFSELSVKYPTASAKVIEAAQREARKAQC